MEKDNQIYFCVLLPRRLGNILKFKLINKVYHYPQKQLFARVMYKMPYNLQKKKKYLRNTPSQMLFCIFFQVFTRTTLGNCFCSTYFEDDLDYYFMLVKCFDNSYCISKKVEMIPEEL